MLIRLRETLHYDHYKIYALNLNTCQRISIIESTNGFRLALDMDIDIDDTDTHIVIERYDTEQEAINAFESLMKAFAEGCPVWDARSTRNY